MHPARKSVTWQAEGGVPSGARDEHAVDLAGAHERLFEELALRVLPAVKQPIALALAQRNGGSRPAQRNTPSQSS